MSLKHFLLTAAATLSLCAAAAEFSVPKTAKAPVIDGKISAGEWNSALKISGTGSTLDHRKAELFLTWDEKNVYVAVRTETPPRGKLVQNVGTNPVHDDSVEFWFDPPKSARVHEQWKFGEFQVIISNAGRMLLQHHNPGYGLPVRNWVTGDMKVVNKVANDQWVCEFSIPAKAFGMNKLGDLDWKILSCVNFRSAPGRQVPFMPVSSFMDSKSYPTFKFRKNAPAVRQLYADAATRNPLKFEGSKALSYEAVINGKTVKGKLPVTLQAAAPSALSMKITDGSAVVYQRNFKLAALPARIWETPESYIVLEQDFEKGADKFIAAPKGAKVSAKVMPSLVPGRKEGSKAIRFSEKAKNMIIRKGKLPVPGNISFWIWKDAKTKKGYVRYFSTSFVSSGYIGLQDHPGFLLLFLHNFKGGNKNIMVARRPAAQTWTHVSINVQPKRIELYCNGMKVSEQDLAITIDPKKLGDIAFGSGTDFAIDEYVVYDRTLAPQEIKAMAQGESSVSGEMAWYPSLNSIVLDLACNPKQLKGKGLVLQVVTKAGKKIYSGKVPMNRAVKSGSGEKQLLILHEAVKMPSKLANGDYIMSLVPEGSESALLEKEFLVKWYEWQNNKLGTRDVLLPGFTPLQVKGNVISAVLRDYTIGKNGLPEKIVSEGKQILAGPVTVNFVKNGKTVSAKGTAAVKPVKRSATKADYTAAASGMKVKGRMEQDGLLILDLDFPANLNADRVYVDIPVKKEFAELYHPIGEHIRANPAGFTPAGQGTVFKSRNVQQVKITNFIPYLWLGTDTRGICYAANWDKDWVHCKERDAVELYRHKNGDVSIRLNLINGPVKYKRARTITIALQASPVKPMPKGWRGWSDGFAYKGNKYSGVLASCPYWGGYTAWAGRYPAFKDFGYIRKLAEAMKTGKIDEAYKKQWIERVLKGSKAEVPWIHSKAPASRRPYVTSHTTAAFNRARSFYGKPGGILYFYTCDADGAGNLPEYPAMQGEWASPSYGACGSYTDYAIYYLDKMLEAGMKGVYDDNTFFRCNYSWATGDAYIDETGEIKPGLNLWNSREYHRRQVVTMMDRGLEPWVTVHHTNANILPTLGFATNSMGMEWKYGFHDFQERFTPDYIRAVCQGLQAGLYPTILDGVVGGTKEKRYWATRTMIACLMPHEIRPTIPRGGDAKLIINSYNYLYDFGVWKDDCKYTAYWNPENPVKSADPKLLTSTYQRGKKLLIVCGSYTGDITAQLTCKGAVKSAKNLETGAALNVSGNKISFPLKKHDFMIIEAELK
ncbi:MAG: hypothetical protein IKB25_11355 [Lentisphaeria bacterium]|nr:hypothetical protein [Lentisphaeria bacterium]